MVSKNMKRNGKTKLGKVKEYWCLVCKDPQLLNRPKAVKQHAHDKHGKDGHWICPEYCLRPLVKTKIGHVCDPHPGTVAEPARTETEEDVVAA